MTGFGEMKNQYQVDPYFSSIVADLQGSKGVKKLPFMAHDGYLFKGNQSCIQEGSLWEHIIRELHGNGLGEYFGRDKTMAMVCDRYFWPKMYKDVEKCLKVSNLPIWQRKFTKHWIVLHCQY